MKKMMFLLFGFSLFGFAPYYRETVFAQDYGAGVSRVRVLAAGDAHTVGLKADGMVVAVGFGDIDFGEWRDIIQVVAGVNFTLGLRHPLMLTPDAGLVVAVGRNTAGQGDLNDWREIAPVPVIGKED